MRTVRIGGQAVSCLGVGAMSFADFYGPTTEAASLAILALGGWLVVANWPPTLALAAMTIGGAVFLAGAVMMATPKLAFRLARSNPGRKFAEAGDITAWPFRSQDHLREAEEAHGGRDA